MVVMRPGGRGEGGTDPLADATGEIVQHMNADRKDASSCWPGVCGVESQEAATTSVDRLGFHVRLKPKVTCVASASHSCEK